MSISPHFNQTLECKYYNTADIILHLNLRAILKRGRFYHPTSKTYQPINSIYQPPIRTSTNWMTKKTENCRRMSKLSDNGARSLTDVGAQQKAKAAFSSSSTHTRTAWRSQVSSLINTNNLIRNRWRMKRTNKMMRFIRISISFLTNFQ